jgi:DNA/RNA endonuclease YhcR with UshA esterase domain
MLLFAPVAAIAHHSTAFYDLVHGTIIAGVVTRLEMLNPHGTIAVDVSGEDGAVEHWSVAIDSPLVLRRLGWTKDSLKPGDKVTVTGNRAKDGSFHMRAVEVQLASGKKLMALSL